MHKSMFVAPIAATLLAAMPALAQDRAVSVGASQSTPASAKAAQLDKLYADFWEESLKLYPIAATQVGDSRYNDQWPNYQSKQYINKLNRFNEAWLAKAEAIRPDGLNGQALLSYKLFIQQQRDAVDGERFHDELLPIDQFSNNATYAVRLGSGSSAQPFKTVKDYDNWLARASKISVIFDQSIANMREGVKLGIVQPKVLMVKVIPQFDAVIKANPEDTKFWQPIKNIPKEFSAADKSRLTDAYRHLIADQLMPSYRKLRDYIANDYMAHTRDTVGYKELPNGEAWYAYIVRTQTTTNDTPDQIHAIGLSEVARIKKEMDELRVQVGFKGDLKAFFRFLKTDSRFTVPTTQALLDGYNNIYTKVLEGMPRDFSILPKTKLEIRPVEAYSARSAAAGSYAPPSEDGKRPGVFYVNTYDLPSRKTWKMEDLFLHEAIPGHHLQNSIQQEQTGLPMFRRFGAGGYTAYIEGYALYCETIGYELGMYTDPYQKFGQLQNEEFRAMRLVVDTGINSEGWTRDQAIAYMLDNSAMSKTEITAEVERYIANPGQALSYKIGQMKITELRAKTEKEFGAKFDVRAFHTELLKDGALPLDVLDATIDAWIAAQRS